MTKRKKTKPKDKAGASPRQDKIAYRISDQFRDDYRNLTEKLQKDVDGTLKLLDSGQFTGGMQTKKLVGDIMYLRAGSSARITYSWGPNKTISLRACGDHGVLDRERKQLK